MKAVYIAFYLALLAYYCTIETGDSFLRRAVCKITLSSLFTLFSLFAFLRSGAGGMHTLLLIAIFFCFAGDTLLLWDLVKGGAFFAVGNVLILVYELWLTRSTAQRGAIFSLALPFIALIFLALYILTRRGHISFARLPIFPIYLLTVTSHAAFGLALAVFVGGTRFLLLGCGQLLFMISDYFLGYGKLVSDSRANHIILGATYFFGLMLISLSFTYL